MRGEVVPCRFCGGSDVDGHHFFGIVLTLLLLRYVKILSFMILMRMDEGHWLPCLLWHGWLPLLSGVNVESPWAITADEAAVGSLVIGRLLQVSTGLLLLAGCLLTLTFELVSCS